jgi:alpha-beta hydrolase superfamily lysophospholipase
MTSITGTRIATDGITLFTRRWQAADPRALIMLVHGLGEHSGRYEHVGAALADHGFEVMATDLRGHGHSEGPRTHIDAFSTYVDDLAGDVDGARNRGLPVVLLGHSLGGLIAVLHAESDHIQADYLVLSAPAVDAEVPSSKIVLARLLARLSRRLPIANSIKGHQLSRDPSVGERYFADPLVRTKSTVGFGLAFLEAMERSRSRLDRIRQPALVIHSGDDPLVLPAMSAPLADLPGFTRVVFENYRHESFNEEGGSTAIQTVVDWIDAQL